MQLNQIPLLEKEEKSAGEKETRHVSSYLLLFLMPFLSQEVKATSSSPRHCACKTILAYMHV